MPSSLGVKYITSLPAIGQSKEKVYKKLGKLANIKHIRQENRRVSSTIYYSSKELICLQIEVFSKFTISNLIYPNIFSRVYKIEVEVIAIVRDYI